MAIKIIILILLVVLLRMWSIDFLNSDTLPDHKIFDICHNILPDLRDNNNILSVYDFYTGIPIYLLILNILKNKDWIILKEYLILMGILNITRVLFYSVTILPDSSKMCKDINFKTNNPINKFFLGTCRDLIFSGHASNSFLAWKFLFDKYKINPLYAIIHQLFLLIAMFCQRRHYSIDVIVAYLSVYLIYDKKVTLVSIFN